MITAQQITQLSKQFRIDPITIRREYLQLHTLNQLYQLRPTDNLYFKGGTAIRLLLDSPRFSEDLDFASNLAPAQLNKLMRQLATKLQDLQPQLQLKHLYSGQRSVRYQLNHHPQDIKFPLNIRLDLGFDGLPLDPQTSALTTEFPIIIFPFINHQSPAEILAEKIAALLSRNKGRDIFDLWYLLERGIKIKPKLLTAKLKAADLNRLNLNKQEMSRLTNIKKTLRQRLTEFSNKSLKQDLGHFLPQDKRQIVTSLKQRLKQYL
jgi:hypothetical protein